MLGKRWVALGVSVPPYVRPIKSILVSTGLGGSSVKHAERPEEPIRSCCSLACTTTTLHYSRRIDAARCPMVGSTSVLHVRACTEGGSPSALPNDLRVNVRTVGLVRGRERHAGWAAADISSENPLTQPHATAATSGCRL